MAITFVGSLTFQAAGAASGTTTVALSGLRDAAGVQPTWADNDFAIINYATGYTADLNYTPPTDYTEDIEVFISPTLGTNHCLWWNFILAADTQVLVPASGHSQAAMGGTIFVFRGVDTSTPFDVARVQASATAAARPNPGAITPTTAGAWIVALGAAATTTASVLTNPGDLSATTNHFRSAAQADTTDIVVGTGIKTDWSSGAFDPAVWTGNVAGGAGDTWSAFTLALRPLAPPAHSTSGALTGQGSTVVGSAAHIAIHTSTGVLAGSAATVVGSAAHVALHTSTGILVGPDSTIAGSAARTRQHAGTGDLSGQGTVIVGSAARSAGAVTHATDGVLAGQSSSVAGSAARFSVFDTSGVLVGQGSAVVGSADHPAGTATHDTSGVLTGSGSTVAGTAAHNVVHTSTGILTSSGSTVAGSLGRASASRRGGYFETGHRQYRPSNWRM